MMGSKQSGDDRVIWNGMMPICKMEGEAGGEVERREVLKINRPDGERRNKNRRYLKN